MEFQYVRERRFFAQAAGGTENAARAELVALGATDVRDGWRGLYFGADDETLYRVTYCARVVTRVLAPLVTFRCHSARYLYRRARAIDWPAMFPPERTIAVQANVANSALRHSQYAALMVKDAIVDAMRDRYGRRPNVDPHDADVRVNLYLQGNRATISLETTGGSTHRRGYRVDTVEAPMQEHVAAAIVHETGWTGERDLVDPMCGSGTLLAEALMAVAAIPSGRWRERFGVRALPDFDEALWRRVRGECDAAVRPVGAERLRGSDADVRAVRAARANLARLPGGEGVRIEPRRFEDLDGIPDAVIVCNPPWGVRLHAGEPVERLLRRFGDFLKRRCPGSTAWIYLGRRELVGAIGLRPSRRIPIRHGGMDGRLVRVDVY